jgi:hypothetical protein
VSRQEPMLGGSTVDDGGSVVVVVLVVVVVVLVVVVVDVVVGGTVVVVVVAGGRVVVVAGGCVVVVVGSGVGVGLEAGCEAGFEVERSVAGAGAAVVRTDGEMNGNAGSVGWDCAVGTVVGEAGPVPAMVVVVVVTGADRGSDAGARGLASADGTSRGAPGRSSSISWTTTRTPPTTTIAARSSFIFMRTTRSSRSSSACSSMSALQIPALGRARETSIATMAAYAHAYGFSPVEIPATRGDLPQRDRLTPVSAGREGLRPPLALRTRRVRQQLGDEGVPGRLVTGPELAGKPLEMEKLDEQGGEPEDGGVATDPTLHDRSGVGQIDEHEPQEGQVVPVRVQPGPFPVEEEGPVGARHDVAGIDVGVGEHPADGSLSRDLPQGSVLALREEAGLTSPAESPLHGQLAEPLGSRSIRAESGGETDEPIEIVVVEVERKLGAETVAGDGTELEGE